MGNKSIRDINRQQKTGNPLLRSLPFERLVREISQKDRMVDAAPYRFQKRTISSVQEATEHYVIEVMQDANRCAIHAGRSTIMKRDFDLAKDIRRDSVMIGDIYDSQQARIKERAKTETDRKKRLKKVRNEKKVRKAKAETKAKAEAEIAANTKPAAAAATTPLDDTNVKVGTEQVACA